MGRACDRNGAAWPHVRRERPAKHRVLMTVGYVIGIEALAAQEFCQKIVAKSVRCAYISRQLPADITPPE
jgi:hypothetical protein